MKTSTAGPQVKEQLLSVCCRAGFAKAVVARARFLELVGSGDVAPRAGIGFWVPVQRCSACGKECEVAWIKPGEK